MACTAVGGGEGDLFTGAVSVVMCGSVTSGGGLCSKHDSHT